MSAQSTPTIEAPAPLIDDPTSIWWLDPAITFLNNGCFGTRRRAVTDAQDRWRRRFEARPVETLDRGRSDELAEVKATVGPFIGAASADFGFVTNATGGCNVVLRSLELRPGDELLTTNHRYNAISKTLAYVTERGGATVREVDIPLPLSGPDAIVEAIEAGIGPKTRLVVIDHISSPTAVVFPVERIVERCTARGVGVLIDGAHAPGMIELDVTSIGAAYYTGNFHKWVGAPLGSAFLYVQPDRQAGVHPNVISHFLDEGLAEEFNWQGTRDISPWVCTVDAIDAGAEIGWDRIRAHNHQMAVWAQGMLCDRWSCEPSTPLDGSMLGSMVSLPIPGDPAASHETPEALGAALYDRHAIEVPVFEWRGRWWMRASCQLYNRPEHYEQLADAMLELTRR